MANKQRVGVVGFTGYSGAELVSILKRHSGVETVLLEHRPLAPDEMPPFGDGLEHVSLSEDNLKKVGLSVVFFATHHDAAIELTPVALAAGSRVVDLSAAFRLRTVYNYERWYKFKHERPDLLSEAVYGLPEYFRNVIRVGRLVSNPGCYPTACNLALRPLITEAVLDRAAGIVCDAKSGVSGAGKQPSSKTHFCSVTENFSAYSVLTHRHIPEVMLTSDVEEREFSFTTQLLPIYRGILETIYVRAAKGVSRQRLEEVYAKYYEDEPFVRIYPEGRLPDLRGVNHTNFCDIGIQMDSKTRRVVIVSAIDNLGKGAAGQAVQNMNVMLGFPETEGLL